MAMTLVTPSRDATQSEETPKVSAPQRSSSVGRMITRLFSTSPKPDANRSTSENSPFSVLGKQTPSPQEPSRTAGVRGRTPPKNSDTTGRYGDPTPEDSSQPPYPTSSQLRGGLLTAPAQVSSSRITMAMASHRGGHPVIEGGWTGTIGGTGGGHQSLVHYGETRVIMAESEIHGSSTAQGGQSSQSAEPATDIIVQYTAPAGQRYLPIFLGDAVTMVRIGSHGAFGVFEPTNRFLRSTEEGLRYHRSVNERDIYDGPLDMARFGRPVTGTVSLDSQWLVSPLAYDSTRPVIVPTQSGEICMAHVEAPVISMSSPYGDPTPLGDYTAQTTTPTTDVEISMLAELGAAVTRGADDIRASHRPSSLSSAHVRHSQQPVPDTAP